MRRPPPHQPYTPRIRPYTVGVRPHTPIRVPYSPLVKTRKPEYNPCPIPPTLPIQPYEPQIIPYHPMKTHQVLLSQEKPEEVKTRSRDTGAASSVPTRQQVPKAGAGSFRVSPVFAPVLKLLGRTSSKLSRWIKYIFSSLRSLRR